MWVCVWCVCVYIFDLHMSVSMYTQNDCMCVRECMCLFLSKCVFVFECICLSVYVCVCVCVCYCPYPQHSLQPIPGLFISLRQHQGVKRATQTQGAGLERVLGIRTVTHTHTVI